MVIVIKTFFSESRTKTNPACNKIVFLWSIRDPGTSYKTTITCTSSPTLY